MLSWRTSDGQIVRRVLTGRSNAYLISNGERHVLIDAGHAIGYATLQRNLARLQVPQEELAALVLTHAHYDHAENAHRIRTDDSTMVIIQRDEAAFLSRGENPMIYGTTRFTRRLTNLLGKRVLARANYAPTLADQTFDESLDLNPFGVTAYALHTPGHSVGSACIVVGGEIALVGDTLFGVFRNAAFPPFADLPLVLIESWKKLLDTGCSLFLPGHGGAVSRDVLAREYEKYRIRAEACSGSADPRPIL
ncbi:MAG TPA: MBL fold metallo-hydrolase [Clostridia bacterium]|nr:MBL fold metallo-hydrolase [Clostridia bacterium]